MPDARCRLGLVALGDSITNGGGNMALGVYPRSWAHWLALALELPFTGLPQDLGIAARAARAHGAARASSGLAAPETAPRARARWARAYARMWAGDVVRRVREGGVRSWRL